GKKKMANGINTVLSNLKDALNKTTALTVDTDSITDTGSILAVALDNLTKRLDKIESKLSTRDRRRRDDDDDDDDDRRRDARRRDDDDDRRRDSRRRRDDDDDDDRHRDAYNYTMRYKGAHSSDDDDDDDDRRR